ncbi:transposase [Methanooceanicella nereidis]|nr:transposase [Methanocella sp. CWC-04]
MSIEMFHDEYGGVSPDVVLSSVNKISLEMMEKVCNRLLKLSVRMAGGARMFVRTKNVSIDYHDVLYYGKSTPFTVKTLEGHKGKRRRCHRYGVASVTGKCFYQAVSIMGARKGVSNLEIVKGLLEDVGRNPVLKNRVGVVLMDKFFAGVDVINYLESNDHLYIMPFKHSKTLDRLYENARRTGIFHALYHMRKKDPGNSVWKTVNVYFIPVEDEEGYYAYISNIETPPGMEWILDMIYRGRWNIEVNFKVKKVVKPTTSSKNPAYRILLETISLILANLWKQLEIRITDRPLRQKQYDLTLHKLIQEMITTPTKNNME